MGLDQQYTEIEDWHIYVAADQMILIILKLGN